MNDDSEISSQFDEEPGERLEPIGAEIENILQNQIHKLSLEENHENLNAALFALTSHFAQVQLRLHQITNAPQEEKDNLLKALEEFAANGLPDLELFREKNDTTHLYKAVQCNRFVQRKLLQKLNNILNALNQSVEMTENDLDCMDMELIEIKSKLNSEYHKYILANNHSNVDNELLIQQLKLQVSDLEYFIDFLRKKQVDNKSITVRWGRQKESNIINEISLLINMLFAFQLKRFMYIFSKKKGHFMIKQRHFGDLRARLELAIYDVASAFNRNKQELLTELVRDNLVECLKNLAEHGLRQKSYPFPWNACFSHKSAPNFHIWNVFLDFYHENNASDDQTCASLSQSFNLNIKDFLNFSDRQSLVRSIQQVVSSHEKFRKGFDVQFKAFVCAALNARKLVVWFKMVLESRRVRKFYYPWSYVAVTKFEDSLRSLAVLSEYAFQLPVNYAIANLENIDEVFSSFK